jgi:hypothetical protein
MRQGCGGENALALEQRPAPQVFTRRIIGFGIHLGTVDGPSLCLMLQRAIQGQGLPKYLSTDNDPLYRFHQWQANLRVLEVVEIKTYPMCRSPIPLLSDSLEL